jgi:cell division septation protein DedD
VNGFIRLSGGMMLKAFFLALLCSSILIEKIHAQEVIVAREKKPEPLGETPEPPKQTVLPSEELPSETPTPTPRKSKPRGNNGAPAKLTLEEMRAAGARAAEGLNDRSVSQPTKTREPDVESTPAPNPTVAETPRPVKSKTPIEQSTSSRLTKPRSTNLEGIGPIRPTMMESGREPPSPSPSER